MRLILLWNITLLYHAVLSKQYKIYYMTNFCAHSSIRQISVWQTGEQSVGIMKMTKDDLPYDIGLNCTAILKTVPNYNLLINFIHVNTRPTTNSSCTDKIELYSDNSEIAFLSKPICGVWDTKGGGKLEYTASASLVIRFTSTNSGYNRMFNGFSLTFTSYNISENGRCYGDNRFKCNNEACIWKGLKCDQYNNCGDSSDEANCIKGDTSSVGIGSYIGLTFAVIFLIIILLCLISPLPRRNTQTNHISEVFTVSSMYQWHNAIAPPIYSETADRPPSYEEATRNTSRSTCN